jgi:hypothetical protein
MKKAIAVILALGMSAAFAASSYEFTLYKASSVNGTQLKPGPVKLDLEGDKVVIKQGKTSVESNVTVQSAERKFNASSVTYNADETDQVQEIRLGGTATKLLFDSGAKTAAKK